MNKTSDLHKKILDNMDSEAKSMENDLKSMSIPKNTVKKNTGFFSKIKNLFFK